MPAALARTAILAMVLLVLSGCRSGAGGSGRSWGFGRKNAAQSADAAAMSAPQLPSTGATPGVTPPNAYDASAAPGGYYDQGTGPGFQGAQQGAPATNAGGYVAAGAAAPAAYGAPPDGYPAGNSATAGYTAAAVAPQAGPYSEAYPQAAPEHAAGAGAAPPAYPSTAVNPPGAPQSYPSTQMVPGAPQVDHYGGANPAADPNAAQYQTADNRNAASYGAAPQAEQAAADRYSAANQGAPDPQSAVDGGAAAERYQPGATNYQPGNTGYSPPGVAPYQPVAEPNVVSTPRRNPYYRPGTTSDYLPSSNAQSQPAAGGNQANPSWPAGY